MKKILTYIVFLSTSLYEGYELKMRGWETKISASIIDKHYKLFSKKILFEFPPPLKIYLEAGQINFRQKEYKKCIEALEVYLEKDSNNSYVYELIGDAYSITGKKKQSRDSYLKASELSLDNIRLKKKLNE